MNLTVKESHINRAIDNAIFYGERAKETGNPCDIKKMEIFERQWFELLAKQSKELKEAGL